MGISRIGIAAALIGASCALPLGALAPTIAHAATFGDIPGPAGGAFGDETLVLSNGNIVVTDPDYDDPSGPFPDAGLVVLFSGVAPYAPIRSLVGGADNDHVGSGGVFEVGSSNFVVASPAWSNGAGATTWVDGAASNPSTVVDGSNSLVGSVSDPNGDHIGSDGITDLTNGNYLVRSSTWGGDGVNDDWGAVTWAPGNAPIVGSVGASNSLIGATDGDLVGAEGLGFDDSIAALPNGDYVVGTPDFQGGAGAVTLGDGTIGTFGAMDSTNSFVGGSGDEIGVGITALSNGNYVIGSPYWAGDRGAATLISGSLPTAGPLVIDATTSLIGSVLNDRVGFSTIALTNGNYIVSSPFWTAQTGAATFGLGAGGTVGTIDQDNSLVGDASGDFLGSGDPGFFGFSGSPGIVALANGNAVIGSPFWHSERGAATLIDGTTGRTGTVDATNSLVGVHPGDLFFGSGPGDLVGWNIVGLAGSRYAVGSPGWTGGGHIRVGAVTISDGVTGRVGTVTTANSLYGSTAEDAVGLTLTALADGDLVVGSREWDNGGIVDAGAATWIDPAVGLVGPVTAANSLVGTVADDEVAGDGVLPMTTGGYIVYSEHSSDPDAWAATYGGPHGVVGSVTADNSVIGTGPDPVFAPCSCDVSARHVMSDGSIPISRQDHVTLFTPDQTPPALVGVPAAIAIAIPPTDTSVVVTYTTPTATDADDPVGPTVSCDRPSGSSFPVGATLVTCTALNYVGLTASGSFTVTVTLQPTPVFSAPPIAVSVPTAPGGTSAVVSYTTPTATDANGAVPVSCLPASGSTFPVGTTTVTCTATNSVPRSAVATFTVTVSATSALADYIPLTPARLADSRPAQTTADGLFAGIGALAAGSTLELTVAGRGGAPIDATAVVLNVTVTDPLAAGFVTLFPCGSPQPTASNLNYTAGTTVANAVATKIGLGGKVCVFTSQTTHLVVDLAGTFPPTSTYLAVNPGRVLDTRATGITVDGLQQAGGTAGAGTVTAVQVTGRAGVPTGAAAAVLNVTVVQPQSTGYATVFPCGTEPPTASNLNYTPGLTVPNLVVAKIGTDGQVCVFTQGAADLVVDVSGYFPSTAQYTALAPVRVLDSRIGFTTIDGESAGIGLRTAGTVTTLRVAGRGGVSATAPTVVLNVTVTGAQGAGYVSVYPCGTPPPNASNVNYVVGQTVANAVIAKVGTGGNVCILTSQATDLVVDVNGFMTS